MPSKAWVGVSLKEVCKSFLMGHELQVADQMGPYAVPRRLGPPMGAGDQRSGGQTRGASLSGTAPLLDLFNMVEDMPEVKFGKKKNTAAKSIGKTLVYQEYTRWAQKPERPG